jgi:hypothetical protein
VCQRPVCRPKHLVRCRLIQPPRLPTEAQGGPRRAAGSKAGRSSSGSGGEPETEPRTNPVLSDTAAQVADRGAAGAQASGRVDGDPQLLRGWWRPETEPQTEAPGSRSEWPIDGEPQLLRELGRARERAANPSTQRCRATHPPRLPTEAPREPRRVARPTADRCSSGGGGEPEAGSQTQAPTRCRATRPRQPPRYHGSPGEWLSRWQTAAPPGAVASRKQSCRPAHSPGAHPAAQAAD